MIIASNGIADASGVLFLGALQGAPCVIVWLGHLTRRPRLVIAVSRLLHYLQYGLDSINHFIVKGGRSQADPETSVVPHS